MSAEVSASTQTRVAKVCGPPPLALAQLLRRIECLIQGREVSLSKGGNLNSSELDCPQCNPPSCACSSNRRTPNSLQRQTRPCTLTSHSFRQLSLEMPYAERLVSLPLIIPLVFLSIPPPSVVGLQGCHPGVRPRGVCEGGRGGQGLSGGS